MTIISEEIARQLENSGAKYVLVFSMFLENIKQACEIYPGIEKIIVMGDVGEGGPNIVPFIEVPCVRVNYCLQFGCKMYIIYKLLKIFLLN